MAEAVRIAGRHRRRRTTPTEARAKLAALADPAGDGVAARLASAIGLSASRSRSRSCSGASGGCSRRLAADRPLVLVVEDIHWAEPTLLDLIEHLVESIDGAGADPLPRPAPELLESAGLGRPAARDARSCWSRSATDDAKRHDRAPARPAARSTRPCCDRVVDGGRGQPAVRRAAPRDARRRAASSSTTGHGGSPASCRRSRPADDPGAARVAARPLAGEERAVIEPASVVGLGVRRRTAVSCARAPGGLAARRAAALRRSRSKHLVLPIAADGDEERVTASTTS